MNSVFVGTTNIEASLKFYVDELALFSMVRNYGQDTYLLAYRRSNDFRLHLSPTSGIRNDGPLFSLAVDDCENCFNVMQQINFSNGAGILVIPHRQNYELQLLEWPLGIFFKMRDPSGNIFVIEETYKFDWLDENGEPRSGVEL